MRAAVLYGVLPALLVCGCLRETERFNTLQDYSTAFERKNVYSLAGRKNLTISEARKIALANNPTLHAAACSIRSAKYSYYRSLSAWAPEISLYGSVDNENSRGYDLLNPPAGVFPSENRFSTSSGIKATWLLFNGLERELDILVAKLEYNKKLSESDDVKRLLLRAVAFIWCDTLLASEEIIIFHADRAFQDAALKQAEQQFKSGHISYSTVLNFKILSARAQSRIALAKYNRQTSLNTLAALLGCNSSEISDDINLQPISSAHTELDNHLNFYLEQAVKHRPDLKAEKTHFEQAIRRKQKAYASFMPEIHLFADFSFDHATASYKKYRVKESHYNQPEFSFGVVGTWNIFHGFDSWNEVRRQKALEEISLLGLNKKFLDITAEIRDALEHCRNTLIQINIFSDMAAWVMEQRNLIYSEYINGRETIARVNQAQSELIEAQSNLALWKIQYQKAAAQLNASLGKDAIPAP